MIGGDVLVCPYCNSEMKSGYISAYNRLCWTPDGETVHGATKWAKSQNSVILAEYVFLGAATVNAGYCERCKKVVIDLRDE